MSFWKGLSKSFGGIASSLTGGLSGLVSGDFGSAAGGLDPGNLFHESSADRRAAQQWQLEYDLSKKNYESQEKWNDLNYQAQQEAFQYQKDLNAMQMEREDTAVQRRVADLKAAGLSPTLAAGSSAQATPVHAGTAPQGLAPQQLPPSAIKAQAAMFKEQMERDYLQMAVGMMSNMADISRTKAETELIRAQKDRFIAETPIELRLKSLEQEFRGSTLDDRIRHVVQETDYNELKLVNQDLNNQIAENVVAMQAYETLIKENESKIKAIEAKYADDIERLKKEKLKEEVSEKTVAVKMAEFLHEKQVQLGMPYQMLSDRGKKLAEWYFIPKATNPNSPEPDLKNSDRVVRWFKKVSNWRSPSLLKR